MRVAEYQLVYATAEDWPEIATMRSAYFRSMGRSEYPAPDNMWVVLKQEGRVVACYTYSDQDGTYVVTDLYRAPGPLGLRALAHVVKVLAEVSSVRPVTFMRDPRNVDWELAVERRRKRYRIELIAIVEKMQCLPPF